VPQVAADRVRPPVEQLVGEREVVERLYQSSRCAPAERTRSPTPGIGGASTSARIAPGRAAAIVRAMRLPMS
jgi:hypothetical protein